MHHVPMVCKRSNLLAIFLLALLATIPLTLACESEEDEAATATATPTPAITDTATPADTPTTTAAGPGITDTEIILGQHAMLSGTFGAVYSMLPQTQQAYFQWVNETQCVSWISSSGGGFLWVNGPRPGRRPGRLGSCLGSSLEKGAA